MAVQLWVDSSVTLQELIECIPSSLAARELAELKARLAAVEAIADSLEDAYIEGWHDGRNTTSVAPQPEGER